MDKEYHRLYSIWLDIIHRCYNPKRKSFKNYGGRGIKVCDRWIIKEKHPTHRNVGFKNFYTDITNSIGSSYELTLDRIDNNGDYEIANLRWSTKKEQAHNRRSNIKIDWKGKVQTLKEVCNQLEISYSAIVQRYNKGIRGDALFEEVKDCKYKSQEFEYNGHLFTVKDISDITNISVNTIWGRIKRGWPIEQVILTPLQKI